MLDEFDLTIQSIERVFGKMSPEEKEERRQKHENEELEQRIARANGLIRRADLPIRHTRPEIVLGGDEWHACLNTLKQRLGSGFIAALVGTRGCGKTQLGVEVIRWAVSESSLRSSRFITAMEFFISIKSSFRRSSETSEDDVLESLASPKLLVIDEVQERSESAWEDRLLTFLVNQRYNAMKDTILIANLTKAEFAQSVGASIVSRLNETGGIIECAWPSFRQGKGKP